MRTTRWVALGVVSTAGVVVLLAGCGTVQAGQPALSDTGVAMATHRASLSPAQQAAADAARMLASFTPPPGAVPVTKSPASLLTEPPSEVASADEVVREGWWVVPGQPATILAWMDAHRPAGSAGGGDSGSIGRYVGGKPSPGRMPKVDPVVSYTEFDLPDVPGVLMARGVVAAVEADGHDRTAIGVYAEVMWLPTRTAASLVPADARIVTITALGGDVPAAADDHPVTITDPATVTRIAAVVNGLPVEPDLAFIECGPTNGPGMQLTFRATAGGPALAVVSSHQELCSLVSLVVGGQRMPELSGSETLFQRVMAIGGFHWNDFPAPDDAPTTPPPTTPPPGTMAPVAPAASAAP